MGHGAENGHDRPTSMDLATAKSVATTLHALATPSRLLILATLQNGAASVTELAESIEMEQSAVSHQLRLLRNLGLVDSERSGRNIRYRLYDDHVAELIEQAISHAEHVRLGTSDRGPSQKPDG
ncbi:MAG: metalloregulator ArsR/SmtB family transcription factor [Nocardioides sp.]|jgi:DNA-binding transcriptional ArsR family regulator|uniref:ArsR/SmtB family transcription factor n=1 Tax=Nocardioides sp. TaxID=35761 RepID=UPI001DFE58D9|nr:metalloregulator ArsR/SmtB family transcription factor [Nocardioides sp.]MBU1802965.1 metalloregulator ArsR/SmtB family transcription factor [Actinomycetota bacterium]MDE0778803.1 metalloregulator ArsR/SmtB family transcription factor [Nocardioides sp.]